MPVFVIPEDPSGNAAWLQTEESSFIWESIFLISDASWLVLQQKKGCSCLTLLPTSTCFPTLVYRPLRILLVRSHQTTSVAKMVSEAWKNMDSEEREKWDKLASEDKDRFDTEKAKYKGPWTVPIGHRRSKVNRKLWPSTVVVSTLRMWNVEPFPFKT